MNTPVITNAQIMRHAFGYCQVHATFDDGTSQQLFSYYPDEISFREPEFTGMTADEARQLRHTRDVGYLQS